MTHVNPADRRAYHKEWRRRNPEKCLAYSRKRDAKHALNPEQRAAASRYKKLKYQYGIDGQDHWEAIFDAQGRKCASCGATDPRFLHGWVVDHDHNNPEPNHRGIVCHPCNIAIGNAKECSARLRACADYLDKHARNNPPVKGDHPNGENY